LETHPKHKQFIKERQYLLNVSPSTVEWYRQSLAWLGTEQPTEDSLKTMVYKMRDSGLRASSVNCRARAINAYLHWNSGNKCPRCGPGCQHPRVPKLKTEHRVLPTFASEDIVKFSKWKPKRYTQYRLQTIILFLSDVGCRINEALGLEWKHVDFDNMLVTLHGKGAKDRTVPFSFELRRYLWKWKQQTKWETVFPGRNGQKLGRRDVLRDVKNLCKALSIAVPERTLHAFRHTFALHYLRNGGSVFHLQKSLGHSSLEMSRRYSNLETSDLQQVHRRVSLLSNALAPRRTA
jgi:integrase/recombinase XerD